MNDESFPLMQDNSTAVSVSEYDAVASCAVYFPNRDLPENVPLGNWRYNCLKRVLDVVCAAIMLLVFLIPGLLIAAIILLTSQGPVFYREQRIGRHGTPFMIWKFRTMHRDVPHLEFVTAPHEGGKSVHRRTCKHLPDPRITRIGSWLRQWSLDELPQLLNVLRGDMSLVGPRPIVEAETVFYADTITFYLRAKPGLTGLWQVSGRSNLGYESRVNLDVLYVQTWSLRDDLRILLRTVPAVLGRVGAS